MDEGSRCLAFCQKGKREISGRDLFRDAKEAEDPKTGKERGLKGRRRG